VMIQQRLPRKSCRQRSLKCCFKRDQSRRYRVPER
jgi:hypothetical protein